MLPPKLEPEFNPLGFQTDRAWTRPITVKRRHAITTILPFT
jgi:hypothetical protein